MKQKRDLKILTVILSLILFLMVVIFIRANQPMMRARREATEIAKEQANIVQVKDFYWFNRRETYFTIVGINDQGDDKVIIIPQDGGSIVELSKSSGITQDQALKTVIDDNVDNHIKNISLGLFEGKPAWEVVAREKGAGLNYYMISFETGEIIHTLFHV